MSMTEYDFLVLSPHEFENISRDLLQKKLSVFIESFTTGKDGGIDLRYAKGKKENIIIQAKRFKDYKSLFNHLTGEVVKVKKLSPESYVNIEKHLFSTILLQIDDRMVT